MCFFVAHCNKSLVDPKGAIEKSHVEILGVILFLPSYIGLILPSYLAQKVQKDVNYKLLCTVNPNKMHLA